MRRGCCSVGCDGQACGRPGRARLHIGGACHEKRFASGLFGFVLLVALTALWGVVYAGFMQLIALKTRSAAATNSGGLIFFPLLFLTPNFVPRDMLTKPMEVAATLNPVTYLMEAMRSLILDDLAWEKILPGFAVVAALGALMLAVTVRTIQHYD
jgi:ABC-2 type transport system permease protein